ncbi:MAG: hypothetical protein WC655_19155 [Candidatus Hydrogenedentales bacterium]
MSSILDALKKLELERDKRNGQSPAQSYTSSTSRDFLGGPDRRGPRTITLTPTKLVIGTATFGGFMVLLSVAVSLLITHGAKSGNTTVDSQAVPGQTKVASVVPAQHSTRPGSGIAPANQPNTTSSPAVPAPTAPAAPPPAPPPAAPDLTPSSVAVIAPPVAPEPEPEKTPEPAELVVTEQAAAAPAPPEESTPRPVMKDPLPAKPTESPASPPVKAESPKKSPESAKPVEPKPVQVAKVIPPKVEVLELPEETPKETPKPQPVEEPKEPQKSRLARDGTADEVAPLDGEGAKDLSETINLSALPTLSESERLRLDLPKLNINIVGLPTKRQPHPSALINLNKVYVGENIPNTDARLIAVELRGVGIEVSGRRYFLPK